MSVCPLRVVQYVQTYIEPKVHTLDPFVKFIKTSKLQATVQLTVIRELRNCGNEIQ